MIIDGLDVSDCPHLKENGSCEHGGSCDGVCFYFGMLNARQRANESEETILKILKLCEEFKNEYAVNYGVQLFARKIKELIAGEESKDENNN